METKPAVYTTEFWIHLGLQLFFILNTAHVWTYMPPRWSGIIQAIMAAAYMLSRGQAKSGVGFDASTYKPAFTITRRRSS